MAYVSTHPLRLRGSRPDRPLAAASAGGSGTAVAPRPSRFVFPILAVGAIFQAIMQTVMVPLLPSMPTLTGADTTAVSWLVTTTLLVGAVMTPIFGRLADMIGKKRMLLVALVLMTVGSLLCAISSNIAVLITARGLQGAGAAIIPIGMSILREELPRERIGRRSPCSAPRSDWAPPWASRSPRPSSSSRTGTCCSGSPPRSARR